MQWIEIRVKEQVDEHWSDWFEGMEITHSEDGDSVISGTLVDEVAIYGILTKIRDLGLHLISVKNTGHDEYTEKTNRE